jgi:hypothetical protein
VKSINNTDQESAAGCDLSSHRRMRAICSPTSLLPPRLGNPLELRLFTMGVNAQRCKEQASAARART